MKQAHVELLWLQQTCELSDKSEESFFARIEGYGHAPRHQQQASPLVLTRIRFQPPPFQPSTQLDQRTPIEGLRRHARRHEPPAGEPKLGMKPHSAGRSQARTGKGYYHVQLYICVIN